MTEPEKKKYRTNYLTQVVCQLNFAAIDSINDGSMKAYKDSLGEEYAELANVTQKGIIVQNDGSDLHTEFEDKTIWQIESSDKTHTITVAQESLAITFMKYEKFRSYFEIISKVHSLFFEQFTAIQQIDRLGLRYVNQIKLPEKNINWADYINPMLTASLGFVETEKIRRSMQSMVIDYDDETRINYNFGIFNQYFPAAIVENEFILDLDAYTSSAQKPSECPRLLQQFNKTIAIYFELSITDKLREVMEVIEDESESEE